MNKIINTTTAYNTMLSKYLYMEEDNFDTDSEEQVNQNSDSIEVYKQLVASFVEPMKNWYIKKYDLPENWNENDIYFNYFAVKDGKLIMNFVDSGVCDDHSTFRIIPAKSQMYSEFAVFSENNDEHNSLFHVLKDAPVQMSKSYFEQHFQIQECIENVTQYFNLNFKAIANDNNDDGTLDETYYDSSQSTYLLLDEERQTIFESLLAEDILEYVKEQFDIDYSQKEPKSTVTMYLNTESGSGIKFGLVKVNNSYAFDSRLGIEYTSSELEEAQAELGLTFASCEDSIEVQQVN